MHRSERPATGSYALVPVENKYEVTEHACEKSVSGKSVNRDLTRKLPLFVDLISGAP